MLALLRRVLFGPASSETRMTRDEAMALAAKAAEAAAIDRVLGWATVRRIQMTGDAQRTISSVAVFARPS